MQNQFDVLIVAREDDGVAQRLHQALETRGRRVCRVDGPAAARMFTVRVHAGGNSVSPTVPMFVRASAWWQNIETEDSDERFLRAEAHATFWAAASLCEAPVINRPGPNGPVYRMTSGSIAAILKTQNVNGCREMWVSGPEILGGVDDTLWGEDMEFLTAPVSQLRKSGPLRARKLNPQALYEIVSVVGKRGFSATCDSRTAELNLIEQSVALVQRTEVHLATVTWAVDENGATPIRLNAAPEVQELRYSWNEVSEALCEDLAS
jgi:hypothetical protein